MKKFDQLSIGDNAQFEVIIDEKMHQSFAKLSGDRSPIHTDEGFSRKSIFGQKIGYAFLLSSFLSRLYGEYLPGGSSICIQQEIKFIKPYFIGDTIKIKGIVSNKFESTKIVEIKTEISRMGKNEVVAKGTGIVKIIVD